MVRNAYQGISMEYETLLKAFYKREFGIINTLKKLNRQLEKVAYSFGNITDI